MRSGGGLYAGVVGEGLTFFVEDGLLVVWVAVDVQVFSDHVPESGFLPEGGWIHVECFPDFSRFPGGEIFYDSVVFLTGAVL